MSNISLGGSIGVPGSVSILGDYNVVFASDANHTLTATEWSNNFLDVTSGVSLTTTRNLIGPVTRGQEFVIQNNTTGGQSIQIIGATGTGITIANGATANVVCDGTNYLQPSASITFANDLTGSNTSQTVVGIRGKVLDSSLASVGASQDGYALTWVNASSDWQAKSIPSGFSAGGDLSGTTSSQTVVNITGTGGNIPFNATIIGEQGTSHPVSFGVGAIVMPSDANLTLSAAQLVNPLLRITSTPSLTATRNIVLPATTGALYYVFNNTTGSQSLQFIASTGTGITIANGLKATIYFDGTNYVVANTAIGGDLSATSNIAQTVVALRGKALDASLATIGSSQDGYALIWTNGSTDWQAKPLLATNLVGGSAQYASATVIGSIPLSQLVIGMLAYDQATAITFQLTSFTPGNGFANGTWSPVVIPSSGSFSPGADTVATTNITLSGEQTINGVTTSGSRVLVTAQTSSNNNGLYTSASGAWSYTSDGNIGSDYVIGKQIAVVGGTFAGNIYVVTAQPATLGSNPLTFVSNAAGGGSSIVGGDLSGTTTAATVAKIQGNAIQSGANGSAQDGYALQWVNGSAQYQTVLPLIGTGTTTDFGATGSAATIGAWEIKTGQSGKFARSGINYVTTTNASATSILSLATASNSLDCWAVSLCGLDPTDGYYYRGDFTFDAWNISGTVTLNPTTPSAINIRSGGAGGASAAISASVSGTNVLIQVTGLASKTWDWSAIAQVQRIA